jgi:hypothetical protein
MCAGQLPVPPGVRTQGGGRVSFYGTDYPDPLAEQERQSAIDRRSLELHSQILDVDGLRKIEPPSPS